MAYHNIHMTLPKLVADAVRKSLISPKRVLANRKAAALKKFGKEELDRRYRETVEFNKKHGIDGKKPTTNLRLRFAKRSRKPVTLAKIKE